MKKITSKKIVVTSGGFDPLHSGHISYLKSAKKFGDVLIVALNSDKWLQDKKGSYFLPFTERKVILESLSFVDKVISFKDDSLGSCINGIKKIKKANPNDHIIFCNGGDRNSKNIPEMSIEDIEFIFGVGGENKLNSSSSILKNYLFKSESRVWGNFYNLFHDQNVKVKELIINPGKGMSFQRHKKRAELWLVSYGACEVFYTFDNTKNVKNKKLNTYDTFNVPAMGWHQIVNKTNNLCRVIEIQYGDLLSEDDIERLRFYEGNNI